VVLESSRELLDHDRFAQPRIHDLVTHEPQPQRPHIEEIMHSDQNAELTLEHSQEILNSSMMNQPNVSDENDEHQPDTDTMENNFRFMNDLLEQIDAGNEDQTQQQNAEAWVENLINDNNTIRYSQPRRADIQRRPAAIRGGAR
jgi:hypothetical protein